MVKTPWFEKAIPSNEAAQVGTRKVIQEHATIGLVVTTDGSFGELPRENFIEAEELTVKELKKQGKPFLILVNSQTPYKEETQKLCRELRDKYGVTTISANCEQLRKEDIIKILENVLYEFPGQVEIQFYIPKWVEMLSPQHELKAQILTQIREYIFSRLQVFSSQDPIFRRHFDQVDLSTGIVRIRIQVKDEFYYKILSEMSGITMESEYDLIHTMKELAAMKEQYVKVQAALGAVRSTGYGVVVPNSPRTRSKTRPSSARVTNSA